jgi:nitrogen-specific signal transduction histidine kinase
VGLLVIMTFLLYDCYVRRRNAKMVDAAARRDEILMSLFPSTVRSRLLEEQEHTSKKGTGSGGGMVHHRLRNFLSGAEGKAQASEKVSPATDSDGYEGKPIADLYDTITIAQRVRTQRLSLNFSLPSL